MPYNHVDIFEILKHTLGCMYISDMKFGEYRERALRLLAAMNIDDKYKSAAYKYLGMAVV